MDASHHWEWQIRKGPLVDWLTPEETHTDRHTQIEQSDRIKRYGHGPFRASKIKLTRLNDDQIHVCLLITIKSRGRKVHHWFNARWFRVISPVTRPKTH